MMTEMTTPTIDEQIAYAKIHAESTAQWLATNPESKPAQTECAMDAAILATLQSIKSAGDDVVEPEILRLHRDEAEKLGMHRQGPYLHELNVAFSYIDNLKAAYKRVCVERDSAKNYVADKEVEPTRIEFASGRVVVSVGGHLEVEK